MCAPSGGRRTDFSAGHHTFRGTSREDASLNSTLPFHYSSKESFISIQHVFKDKCNFTLHLPIEIIHSLHFALLISPLLESLNEFSILSYILFPSCLQCSQTDRVEDRESRPLQPSCSPAYDRPVQSREEQTGNNHLLVFAVQCLLYKGHLARRRELEGWRSTQALCSVMR